MNIPNPHILIISNLSLGLTYGALVMFIVAVIKRTGKKTLARPTAKQTPPALTDFYELVCKIGELEVYAPRENKRRLCNDNPLCAVTVNSKAVPADIHWLEAEEDYLLPAPQK